MLPSCAARLLPTHRGYGQLSEHRTLLVLVRIAWVGVTLRGDHLQSGLNAAGDEAARARVALGRFCQWPPRPRPFAGIGCSASGPNVIAMSPSAVPQSAQTGAASASGGVIAGRTRAFLGGRSTGCSSPPPSRPTAHRPGRLPATAEL